MEFSEGVSYPVSQKKNENETSPTVAAAPRINFPTTEANKPATQNRRQATKIIMTNQPTRVKTFSFFLNGQRSTQCRNVSQTDQANV